jgi:septal ring factor EnvC (AmiA/AmiB activator)
LLLCLLVIPSIGQNRRELVEKRKRLMQEIEQTEDLLQETQENKALALDRYFALQNQIRRRQQLINTLQAEIDYANESIERSRQVLESLREDVQRLKGEYTTMLRVAYRHRLSKSFLAFLFSAESINDAFRRWQYIRQYDRFRRRQAELILETQAMLTAKTEQLELRRNEKQQLLSSEQHQKSKLNRELANKDKLLKNLKSDEAKLVAELETQRKAHEQLNSAIEEVIREEMARKRKASRTPDALTASNTENAVAAALGGNFQGRKGALPWPVDDGEISRHYGTQPHPTIKSIQITNNGIDIRTAPTSTVHAVFAGKVAGTQFIPGYQYMVIMQHGQYYTVYSNLEEIYVKRGDVLNAEQTLGRVNHQKPEVHFEVWHEKERLNPVHWVAKR